MWRGDCADGQLTARGARQHADLGSSLRARWIDDFALIPAMPDAASLSLRSTDIPRTRESAENLLASLLPQGIAGGGPIPLERRPFTVETMLGNPARCPRFPERWGELTTSPTWREREKQREQLRAGLDSILDTAHAAGWGTNPSMDHYFDALHCRTCHAKPLPCASASPGSGCVTKAMAEATFVEGDWEYATLFSDPELARLAVRQKKRALAQANDPMKSQASL